ncbi:MAG: hypothetical protein HN348_26250, partial [Proteobacteria bacterium]|nr:hypothetical protein [Pseudomonadota bacterium]
MSRTPTMGATFGPYTIDVHLGSSEVGDVYEASHSSGGRYVIKVLVVSMRTHGELLAPLVESPLEHRNIVPFV